MWKAPPVIPAVPSTRGRPTASQAPRDIPVLMARRKDRSHPPAFVEVSDEDVERFRGQWVAVKDGRVIFGSPDGGAVWDWLDEQGIEEATIFRIRGKDEPTSWTYGRLLAAH